MLKMSSSLKTTNDFCWNWQTSICCNNNPNHVGEYVFFGNNEVVLIRRGNAAGNSGIGKRLE